MKKERNPIVVVLCMLLLLTVIVLPPVFRKLVPREEVNNQKDEKSSIAVLKCNKTFMEEQYEENTTIKYINGKISTNRIIYTKLEEDSAEDNTNAEGNSNQSQGDNTVNSPADTNTPTGETTPITENNTTSGTESPTVPEEAASGNESEDSSSFKTVKDELNYFKSLNNINVKEEESQITILINKKSITDNADDMRLINYFQDKLSNQQAYYESIGYTCNVLES